MKITRKDLPASIIELIVEETPEKMEKYKKEAIKYLQDNAEVKGFRKGAKIPEEIIIRQFGDDYINERTINIAIDKMYQEALKKEKLNPIAPGQIKEIISESPLSIRIHIEVLPKVTIDEKYKKISLKKLNIEVNKEEVENAIKDIENRFTQFVEDKKGKIVLGDKVTISADGYEGDKMLPETSLKNYPLIVGSNILIPGFEEQLVGSTIGAKLDLPITFPKDYHNKDFAGKKTIFKTVIEKIEKPIKPEFTPEFIEQLRGKKLDFDGFKELIKDEIKDTKIANERIRQETELVDELLKVSKLDIGVELLENQTNRIFEEIKQNMANDGMSMSNYLESLKLSEEQYKEKHVKPIALKRLQGELILHELRNIEDIKITDEEIKNEIEKVKEKFQNKEVLDRIKELYKKGTKNYDELKERLAYRKLIESFFKE